LYAPVTFGFVPSLGELELSCGSSCDQREFKVSELLHGVTGIHTLTLDFQGDIGISNIIFLQNGTFSLLANYSLFILSCDQLWLQPEIKELFTAFNKLRKLSIRFIFVVFDILWTMAFLMAAPSIDVCISYQGDFCISFLLHLEL
jgi:hypothetical protein